MTVVVCWLVFPLILGLVTLGCGLLVERTANVRLPGALLLPLGLAGVTVVSNFVTLTDATAELATPAVVTLAIAGLALSRKRVRTVDGWAVAAGAGVFGIFAAPVVEASELGGGRGRLRRGLPARSRLGGESRPHLRGRQLKRLDRRFVPRPPGPRGGRQAGCHAATRAQLRGGAVLLMGNAQLRAGTHRLTLRYGGADLHPGSAGLAVSASSIGTPLRKDYVGKTPFALGPLVLTPRVDPRAVSFVPPSRARTLCGRSLDWIEVVA